VSTDGRRWLWFLAKFLEGLGMVLVLVGLTMSVGLGMEEEGLKSMQYEGTGLLLGGGLFFAGWILERSLGAR
jgi:hypothetical protein